MLGHRVTFYMSPLFSTITQLCISTFLYYCSTLVYYCWSKSLPISMLYESPATRIVRYTRLRLPHNTRCSRGGWRRCSSYLSKPKFNSCCFHSSKCLDDCVQILAYSDRNGFCCRIRTVPCSWVICACLWATNVLCNWSYYFILAVSEMTVTEPGNASFDYHVQAA
jgi:hypothetical protein